MRTIFLNFFLFEFLKFFFLVGNVTIIRNMCTHTGDAKHFLFDNFLALICPLYFRYTPKLRTSIVYACTLYPSHTHPHHPTFPHISLLMVIKQTYGNKKMFPSTGDYTAYTYPITLNSKLFQHTYKKMQRSKILFFLFFSFFFQNHPT